MQCTHKTYVKIEKFSVKRVKLFNLIKNKETKRDLCVYVHVTIDRSFEYKIKSFFHVFESVRAESDKNIKRKRQT